MSGGLYELVARIPGGFSKNMDLFNYRGLFGKITYTKVVFYYNRKKFLRLFLTFTNWFSKGSDKWRPNPPFP